MTVRFSEIKIQKDKMNNLSQNICQYGSTDTQLSRNLSRVESDKGPSIFRRRHVLGEDDGEY